MSQPTPFDRQTSFALFSAENPLVPHSGVSLDAEFNAVKLSLDETQQNLALIQDDDGVLARGSVGRAQLDASITIGFGAPSQWVAGKLYTASIDTVFNTSIFYICKTTHTSGVSFDATKWTVIADFTVAAVIADGSITSAKLAAAAVDASKIADGSISSSKMASGAVTTSKIADAAVTFAKLDATMGPTLANLLIPAGLGPLPWSRQSPPVGWDWADGGVLLSSTAFPTLRTAYITDGFPFGQDGSGNPKKPDMRGRVPIGWDTMSGAAANRVTTAGSGIDGATFGSVGGVQNVTLAQANLPNVTLSVTGTVVAASTGGAFVSAATGFANAGFTNGGGGGVQYLNGQSNTIGNVTVSSANAGGSINLTAASINGNVTQQTLNNMQPGLICGMIVKAH